MNDCVTVSYKKNGEWKFFCFEATTDPGDDYMNDPIVKSKGCAILKEGQYRGSHKIRLHQGKYPALGQKKNVKVYRDNDRDGNYDRNEATIDEGLFGINIHRATSREGKTSTYVDKWSAGCQVIASNDDWKKFMAICERAKDIHGNSFSYTLLKFQMILFNLQSNIFRLILKEGLPLFFFFLTIYQIKTNMKIVTHKFRIKEDQILLFG